MRYEIEKHWHKLLKISKLADAQLKIANTQIMANIYFVDELEIPQDTWMMAENVVKNIDIDDIDFVALTQFLKAILWTGGKILYRGLKNTDSIKVMNIPEMAVYRSANIGL
jgi:predicted nucleic acid-binding protein